ncbi:MAG TPA: 50S ribosomal protein L10 [Thermoproteota archaeon]|nr:50S ribosomal protein L10 [Thermoproteota archaeon]
METLKPAIARKKEETEKVSELISGRHMLMLISAERVRASLLNEMRDEFIGRLTIKYTKPSILRRALESKGDQSLKELAQKYIKGSTILVLSDEEPFRVAREFRNRAVQLPAKAGDVASGEVIVEPGNTGLPPGPVISELNEAGIPTRIETGSVWVTKRTVVAKSGDVISARLASALSKLGMKPIRSYLRPKCAWYAGSTIEGSILETSLEEITAQLTSSWNAGIALAIAAGVFMKDSVYVLLSRAGAEASALAKAVSFGKPESATPSTTTEKDEESAPKSGSQTK